jgi:hypothetical protein
VPKTPDVSVAGRAAPARTHPGPTSAATR